MAKLRSQSNRPQELSDDDVASFEALPLAEELKSTTVRHGSGYWDLLKSRGLKLSFNRQTLGEFDRRESFKDQRRTLLEERPPTASRVEIILADLKRFARQGGPDLSNIRGYQEPEIGMTRPRAVRFDRRSKLSGSASITQLGNKLTKLTRCSAYKSDFMRLLNTDCVERARIIEKPANIDELRNRLQQRRGSLSPTRLPENYHKDFLLATELAFEEAQVMTDVFSLIKGPKSRPSRTNCACPNWAPLVSSHCVIPQPDFFDGIEESASNVELRQTLDGIIVPSTSANCPFLPNFFTEIKPPNASSVVLQRQAIYDGAFGARAMHHVKAYGAEESFDGNAYTLTSTYINGRLEILAHYLTAPESPRNLPHYRVASIGKYLLDDETDTKSFLSGLAAFRNARDFAQEKREAFTADANRRMHSLSQEDRARCINEAIQRIQEIFNRNGSFAGALLTSQESPPGEEQMAEEDQEEEIYTRAGSDIAVVSLRQLNEPPGKRSWEQCQARNRQPQQPHQRRKRQKNASNDN